MADAIVIVHWPGQDVMACIEHAEKLKNLAGVLGFSLSMNPLSGTGPALPCSNCANEQKLSEAPNG